ncbi:MAG: tyrosine-type recombinase/integrase [Pseudomonadota bacterium]
MNAKPGAKERWISESLIWGHGSLAARITPSGERLFYFRYVNTQGERITLPLATYDRDAAKAKTDHPLLERIGKTLTLSDARSLGNELAEIHKGITRDVAEHLEQLRTQEQEAKQAKRQEKEQAQAKAERTAAAIAARMTVEALFNHWLAIDAGNRKDGGGELRRSFTRDVLPLIGHLHVEDVKKGHILQVVDPILARGTKRMAKVTFANLRQMFRFAVDRDIIEHDPSAAIRKAKIGGKDTERDRVLAEDEIRTLAKQMPDAGLLPTTEAAVWIALSTCCRIGELLAARWEHIDLERMEWTIPAENSKNGKPHTVYLSRFAAEQFRRVQAYSGHIPWIYPNTKDTGPVCAKTITKQLTDRQRQPGNGPMSNRSAKTDALLLPGGKWTSHDLRRTGATLMVTLGVIPEVAERCLNHTEENKVKRIYQRHNYADEMREAWRLLGECLALLTNVEADNVVIMRGKCKR